MGSDLYFFEQIETRKVSKRYRKLPEDLPESLRFAHLNPKVAALLASKERGQKVDSEDPFGDGLGKKSLLPDINAAFQNVRNQFDSALSNDEDSQRYLFEEAKISATTILHQLSQIIYFYEDLFKFVPKSLEYHLMSGYSELTNDVVVVPREWQTQEMKEQYMAKQQQELNANSEEELSENELNVLTGRSKSRLGTERSGSEMGAKLNVKKNKPRLGVIDQADDTESIMPKSESRQGKRSDSRLSITSQIRPHIDVGNLSRLGSRRKGGSSIGSHRSIYAPSPSIARHRTRDDAFSQIAETPSEARSTGLANQMSYMQTINFQLSNSVFEDKGWIMLKGRQEEIDQNQILEYCVQRLQESLKSVTAQANKEVEQGYDKSVIVRYYGDTKKETLLKYRKSPNKLLPNQGNKVFKPKVPSIIDERNEGKKLMQASHIDGSTVIYYPSGRPAVVYSAAGFGRPGYYTIVYEDGIDARMLACFTPSGRGVCYYDNGVVRFLATEKGGHLSEVNGKLIRKWKWPQANVKITEPVSFQMNNHLMFRCVGQTQMTIVFSCQREMSRFGVGLVPEADEYKPIEETDQLLTAFTFSSKAAKDLMRIFAPAKKNKKKSRKKKGEIDLDGGADYDVKKQVSFVDTKKHRMFSQENRFRRLSMSPELLRGRRRQSISPDRSLPPEKDLSDNDVDDGNVLDPDIDEGPFRGGSVSPDRGRSASPSPTRELSRSSLMNDGSSVREKSSKEIPVSPSSSQGYDPWKETVSKRQSVTPDPPKLNSLGREYCKRKRIQSAQKPNIRFNQFMHNKSLRTRKEKPWEKEKPKISEESNLFVQTDAYTDKWEHKKIADEEARKAEKEAFKLKQEKKGKRRKAVMKKMAIVNIKSQSPLPDADTGKRASGKSHSAKHQPVLENDGVGKRAQSALPYGEHSDSGLKGKPDSVEGMENEKPPAEASAGFVRRPKTAAVSKVKDANERKNEIVVKENLKEEAVKENLKEGAEKEDTEKQAPKMQIIPKIIIENPEGSQKCLLQGDSGNISNTEDEKSSKPGKFRVRGYSMFQTLPESTEEKEGEDIFKCRSRRPSALMESILAFRRNVLKKKGIVFNEPEEESNEDSDDMQTSKSQSSEILKLLQDFPDKVHYELEADKELARLQRKAKNLVDDWMEHYRFALGLAATSLQNLRDKPNYSIASRTVKSAKLSDHQLQIRRAVLGVEEPDSPRKKNRIPSAPLGGLGNEFIDEDFQAELNAHQDHTGVTFEDSAPAAGDGTMSPMATAIINRLTETASRRSARSRATSARSSSPVRQPTVVSVSERVPSAAPSLMRSHCPLVIRQQLLGHERPQCRCSRHHIPFIMDLEFDDFINTETPEGQLTVIMVVSSLKNIKNQTCRVGYDFYVNKEGKACRRVFPGITKAEEMLNEIYCNQNRNRTRPCVQSRSDMFRVFKYDVNSAAEMSDHTQPLLMMRHNVIPGMILIYCDGNLYFCDHIFNGYGNTRKDFKKQLMKSRHDAIHGNALPKDFRFSPSRGKSGMRSAWGGEIGGAGVDKYSSTGTVVDNTLQPIHRPNSDSSDSELNTNLHLDAVKLQAAQYLSMSLSATGFQPATLTQQPIATNHLQPV